MDLSRSTMLASLLAIPTTLYYDKVYREKQTNQAFRMLDECINATQPKYDAICNKIQTTCEDVRLFESHLLETATSLPSNLNIRNACDWTLYPKFCLEKTLAGNKMSACYGYTDQERIPSLGYTPLLIVGLATVIAILAYRRSISTESSKLQSQTEETQLEPTVNDKAQVESLASEEASESSLVSE